MTTAIRYSDEDLAMFDQLIDEKLVVARKQLELYRTQLQEFSENDENKVKALDDTSGTMELKRITDQVQRTQKHITHLENAKLRILNKVYGICRETGKLISKERLKAVPHATLSIAAKEGRK